MTMTPYNVWATATCLCLLRKQLPLKLAYEVLRYLIINELMLVG
jgi:hypothetical protein